MSTSYEESKLDSCSPDIVSDIFGVQFCAKGSYYPGSNKLDPVWYFRGPSKVEIYQTKVESFDKLTFEYTWDTDDTKPEKGIMENIKLNLDTPGSQVKRNAYIHLKYDDIKTFFLLDINIPLRNTQFELRYDWTFKNKIVKLSLKKDGDEYFTHTNTLQTFPGKYEGSSKMIYMNSVIMDWTGTMYNRLNRYTLHAELNGLYHDPITISSDYSRAQDTVNLTSRLRASNFNVGIVSEILLSSRGLKTKTALDYEIGILKGNIDIFGKYGESQRGMLNKKAFSLSVLVRN